MSTTIHSIGVRRMRLKSMYVRGRPRPSCWGADGRVSRGPVSRSFSQVNVQPETPVPETSAGGPVCVTQVTRGPGGRAPVRGDFWHIADLSAGGDLLMPRPGPGRGVAPGWR